MYVMLRLVEWLHIIYPTKYAYNWVLLCFVVVLVSFRFDGLLQERRNSIANALELRLSCTNPSNFIHILLGDFIGIGTILWLSQCQWSSPETWVTKTCLCSNLSYLISIFKLGFWLARGTHSHQAITSYTQKWLLTTFDCSTYFLCNSGPRRKWEWISHKSNANYCYCAIY